MKKINDDHKCVDGEIIGRWVWVQHRPRLCWMDGVKAALVKRGMTVGALVHK